MISSAEIAMPISARHRASARQAITSLSTSTPSQSKMMSSGRTETSYTNSGHASAIELLRSPKDSPIMRLVLRLCLAAVLPLLLSDAAPPPRTVLAATPISRLDTHWWRALFEAKQQELRTHHVDLIFLGDSITQDYELSGPPEWHDFAPVWRRF